jgi:hypothetical protein
MEESLKDGVEIKIVEQAARAIEIMISEAGGD